MKKQNKFNRSMIRILLIICLNFALFSTSFSQKYTFKENNLTSNMITTSKHALISQNTGGQPILKKLNFQTMKLETIFFNITSDKLSRSSNTLRDFKNGEIAFGKGYQLFILNNQTLEIKQVLSDHFSFHVIGDIMSYTNPKTNESIYLVGQNTDGMLFSELKRDKDGQYSPEVRFATPKGRVYSFAPTGLNSAVLLQSCWIQYWTNLHSLLDRQTDVKYLMKKRQYIAVSYSESFFVLRNDTGFYEFYTLHEDYDVTFNSALFVSYNQHKKGILTNDDKFLFLLQANPRNKHNVIKVDIANGEFTFVVDTDGSSDNQLDFALFEATLDRLVTLSVKNKNYYLQLRTISTLTLLHQQMIHFDFPVLEYKLIGSSQWGLNFALAVRTSYSVYNLEIDSKVYALSIQDNKISFLNFNPFPTTFQNLRPSFKYIVSYKPKSPTIKFINISNLMLAGQIQADRYNDLNPAIEKSIIMIYNSIFNISQSFQSKGRFWLDPSYASEEKFFIIFPKRGIIYYATTQAPYSFTVTKGIYDIANPAITSSSIMSQNSFETCNSAIYYIPPNSDSKCNLIFYINLSLELVRFDECTRKQIRFALQPLSNQVSSILYVSTDKKYIIALQAEYSTERHLIEVRSISKLEAIVFRKIVNIQSDERNYYMDLANDKLIILKTSSLIMVFDINSDNDLKENTENLHLSSN